MRLSDLSQGIAAETAFGNLEITGVTADSRKVAPGFLFVAVPGAKANGVTFVADAKARGAAAVLTDEAATIDAGLPVIPVRDVRRALALMASRFYGERQPATMVAVTGTSGKTSITAFARQIWSAAGFAAASIGTTGVVSPSRDDYGSLTTPDPVGLAKLLSELAEEGVTHAAMEASSHGIEQRRLDAVRLSAAAFSNLGRDHLDYHATMEDYFAAKMRLFQTLLPKGAPAVVFADDLWSDLVVKTAEASGVKVLTVGRKGSFLTLKRLELERWRQIGEIEAEGELHRVVLPLAGEFQMANALVAAGLAIATGVPAAKALAALEHLKGASGRLDLAGTTPSGVPVFVDYAHKPEALENVLSAVRPFTTGRVIVVFGCGGDRDRGKRPIMGEIAARLADIAIVTDDNPRTEDPATIRAAIMAAARGATEIGDRRAAIRHAVAEARAGDTVVIAGKGHENGQTIGEETHPFSDHEEVRAAIGEGGK
ncbi:UDP-N-acetylmuramoyl-L-alanyl-D-glutamate--2,6-diaminopimelate ligase [Consotaella salsifontis]|uniref:UDP-N-acetylmuramoyl-L-alanyl-D-glutamate--2,6-diaminopimelate ligase n=1 Tax=Consotaella salsifontis TaxID=1365950 RepID=A0A1T4MAA9_9HYPH|nr:UDP-N-acetylmuramoyl-L-alanyl-D-glutamate--2,6-diaminopimelate ligase [Consotaella salsifontis]SJZ63811.1 UDP-N-acetylmuramoylalanyl-D-glutamate--2,6-diaminopimelate ligase [Consotaella salsifontis]